MSSEAKVRRFNHEYHPMRAYNQSLMMPAADGQYIEASEVDHLVADADAVLDMAVVMQYDEKYYTVPKYILDALQGTIARFAK